MFDSLISMIKNVLNFYLTAAVILFAGILTLYQIGRHNRTMMEKISSKGEKLKRGFLGKVVNAANNLEQDDIADDSMHRIGNSYITSFFNDVKRGCKVVSKSCGERFGYRNTRKFKLS